MAVILILTIWMTHDLDNLRLPPAPNLTVQTVKQVKTSSYKFPSPTFVANAVVPEVCSRKRRVSWDGITDEAVGSVRVHAEKERNEQMMSVPESLEGLLSDPVMRGRIDEKHTE